MKFLFLLFAGLAFAQVEVRLPDVQVAAGDGLTLEMTVTDLSGNAVMGVGFEVAYDPAVIRLDGVSLDGGLAEGWGVQVHAPEAGRLRVSLAGSTALQGSGMLLTLTGAALADGVSPLDLVHILLNEGSPVAQPFSGHVWVSDGGDLPQIHLQLPEVIALQGETLSVPLQLDRLANARIHSVSGEVLYDPLKLRLDGIETAQTLTAGWSSASLEVEPGRFRFSLANDTPVQQTGVLLVFQGVASALGSSSLVLTKIEIDETPMGITTEPGRVDVVDQLNPPRFRVESIEATLGQSFELDFSLDRLTNQPVHAFQGELRFDPLFTLDLGSLAHDLPNDWSLLVHEPASGVLTFSAAGSSPLNLSGTHFTLDATAVAAGQTVLGLNALQLNEGSPAVVGVDGVLVVTANLAPEVSLLEPEADLVVGLEQEVAFSADGHDPDGHEPLIWLWRFEGGIPDRTGRAFTRSFSQPGVYRVTVTLIDALGALSTSEPRTLTVVDAAPPNGLMEEPLEAHIFVSPGTAVQFAGRAARGAASDHTYHWRFGDVATSTTARPEPVIFQQMGDHDIVFTVTNQQGLSDPTPATCLVTVSDRLPPQGRIVQPAEDLTVIHRDAVVFQAEVEDATGGPYQYFWDFGEAAPPTSGSQPTVRFDRLGTFLVKLTVRNALGNQDPTPAVRRVTVIPTPPPYPEGSIINPNGDVSLSPGQSINVQGAATGIGQLEYRWDFGEFLPPLFGQNPGPVVFTIPGDYVITLRVRDENGVLDPDPPTRRIHVSGNRPPRGRILQPDPETVIMAGDSLRFRGDFSDEDGSGPHQVRWDMNGATADMSTLETDLITFNAPGDYLIQLIVTDADGAVDPLPPSVRVLVLAEEPQVDIVVPATHLHVPVGTSVDFAGDVAAADMQYPLKITWSFDGAAPNTTLLTPGPVLFDQPGQHDVTLEVEDRFGFRAVTQPRRITVLPCPVVTLPGSIPVGVGELVLHASINCATTSHDWYWMDPNGASFGAHTNPVIIENKPYMTSNYQFVLLGSGQEMRRMTTRILVADDPRFQDFNGDGENTREDLNAALLWWSTSFIDADGDDLLTILDLLYLAR